MCCNALTNKQHCASTRVVLLALSQIQGGAHPQQGCEIPNANMLPIGFCLKPTLSARGICAIFLRKLFFSTFYKIRAVACVQNDLKKASEALFFFGSPKWPAGVYFRFRVTPDSTMDQRLAPTKGTSFAQFRCTHHLNSYIVIFSGVRNLTLKVF